MLLQADQHRLGKAPLPARGVGWLPACTHAKRILYAQKGTLRFASGANCAIIKVCICTREPDTILGAFMGDFLSQAWPFAAAVLVILGIVALVFLIIILYRASVTMKSVQNIAADAEKEVAPALTKVNPMVDKAELMLDTVNLEMLRVDAILEDVEQITDVAGKAATTVDAVTSAPAEAVTSIFDRIRGSLGTKRSNKVKQERLVYPIGGARETDEQPAQDAQSQTSPADDEAMKAAAQQAADTAAEGVVVEEVDIVIEESGQAVPHAPAQEEHDEAAAISTKTA